MSDTMRTHTFAADGPLSLRLKQQSTGDVTVHFDAPEGQASITLEADRSISLGEITAVCRGGEIQCRIPARPESDGRGAPRRSWGPFGVDRRRWNVDADIHLPAHSAAVIEATCGDVHLDGQAGPLSLVLGTGDAHVGGCAGGTVTTGSGDVLIDGNHGDLVAKIGSGDLRATHHRGVLRATAGSGDLELDQRGGSVEATTGTGDIRVAVPRRVPVWLDLSSATGDVERDIEPVGAPTDGEPFLSLRAASGTGDVVVHH